MKKKIIPLLALVAMFLIGTNVHSESPGTDSNTSKLQELLEILELKEDYNEFDIINGTIGSKPKIINSKKSSSNPIRGFISESNLKIAISLIDIYDVEIVRNDTGDIIETLVIPYATTAETYINVNSWSMGEYSIYIYPKSATEDEDEYYVGEFTIE